MFENTKIAAAMALEAIKPVAVKDLGGNLEHGYLQQNPVAKAIMESHARPVPVPGTSPSDLRSTMKPVGSNGIGAAVPRGMIQEREALRKKRPVPAGTESVPPSPFGGPSR